MTFPNANKPPLICIPSFNRAPCAPLRLHRSLPARSTQWIFDLTTAMCDEALTSPLESSTKCLRRSTVSEIAWNGRPVVEFCGLRRSRSCPSLQERDGVLDGCQGHLPASSTKMPRRSSYGVFSRRVEEVPQFPYTLQRRTREFSHYP